MITIQNGNNILNAFNSKTNLINKIIYKMDTTILIEMPIEEPKKRGKPKLLKVEQSEPVETRSRGRPKIIKQLKDPKKLGRQK